MGDLLSHGNALADGRRDIPHRCRNLCWHPRYVVGIYLGGIMIDDEAGLLADIRFAVRGLDPWPPKGNVKLFED